MTVGVTGTPINIQVTFRGLHRNDKLEMIAHLKEIILEFWEDLALVLPAAEQTNCWQRDFMKHYKVNAGEWDEKTKDAELVEILDWIAGSIAEEKINDKSIIEITHQMYGVILNRDNLLALVKNKTIE